MGALCADVCLELGVENRADLEHVTKEMLNNLPKYVKDKIKPVHRKKWEQLIASQHSAAQVQRSAAGGGGGGGAERATDEGSGAKIRATSVEPQQEVSSSLQVFLGYRVSSDAGLVEQLYYRLKAHDVQVWWDVKCLAPEQPWEEGFADGLSSSAIFVPILSKAALAPCAFLTATSTTCDNVLLEHQMAMELKERGDIRAVFPVLVGELMIVEGVDDSIYGDFFRGGGMPTCGSEVVQSVEAKLVQHLDRLGKGAPRLPASARTVSQTLQGITAHQGVKLEGMRRDAMDKAVAGIVALASSLRNWSD